MYYILERIIEVVHQLLVKCIYFLLQNYINKLSTVETPDFINQKQLNRK